MQLYVAKEQFKIDCKIKRKELELKRAKENQKLTLLRRQIAKDGGDANMVKSKSLSLDHTSSDDEFDEKEEWNRVKSEIEDELIF